MIRCGNQPGFTLLEMIVVLAILGLVTAVVAPSALRSIDSWQRQAAMDSVLDQIRALPGNARGSGRSIEISNTSLAADPAPLHIETGWALEVATPWQVSASGVCAGGEVQVKGEYGSRRIIVAAPFCDPEIAP